MMHSTISPLTILMSREFCGSPEVIRIYIAVLSTMFSAVNNAKIISIQKFQKKGRKKGSFLEISKEDKT